MTDAKRPRLTSCAPRRRSWVRRPDSWAKPTKNDTQVAGSRLATAARADTLIRGASASESASASTKKYSTRLKLNQANRCHSALRRARMSTCTASARQITAAMSADWTRYQPST
jgi:hypothetical protein